MSSRYGFISMEHGLAGCNDAVSSLDLQSLPKDCIWYSDLSPEHLKTLTLGTISRIKSNRFFATQLKTIKTDLGLTTLSADEQVACLSELFDTTMKLSHELGIYFDSDQTVLVPNDKTLACPKGLEQVLLSAQQRYCHLEDAVHPFSVFMPSPMLLRVLENSRYPASGFVLVNEPGDAPSPDTAFVCVDELKELNIFSKLPGVSFKDRIIDGQLWISKVEHEYFSNVFEKKIPFSQSVCAEFKELARSNERTNRRKALDSASYSCFLLTDCWIGNYCGYRAEHPLLSQIYCASLARLQLIQQVIRFQNSGFSIAGYGGNRIMFSDVPLRRQSEFIQLIKSAGYVPQAFPHPIETKCLKEETYYDLLLNLTCQSDANGLLELNRILTAD